MAAKRDDDLNNNESDLELIPSSSQIIFNCEYFLNWMRVC